MHTSTHWQSFGLTNTSQLTRMRNCLSGCQRLIAEAG
ncbi:hypothetical protein X949_4272 [Burkholderia pseudomallei MSHR5609]|nr:hypothetical protein X949_4272 [Burkholderia pseudomallei MSHR5609]